MRSERGLHWVDVLGIVILLEIFFLVAGLIFAGGYIHARFDQAAYRSAPFCGPATPGDCRGQHSATIVDDGSVGGKGGSSYWVTTDLPGMSDQRTWVWRWQWLQLPIGRSFPVETWGSRIVLINGVETRDHPNQEVQNGGSLAIVDAGFMLVLLIPGVPALLVMLRRRRQSRDSQAAAA